MIEIEEHLDFEEQQAIDFAAALRRAWSGTVYPALEAEARRAGPQPRSLDAATEVLHGLSLYPWFSHLERQQQKMMWWSATDAVLRRRDDVLRGLRVPASGTGSIELDPTLPLPDWYTDFDIHIQPGAVFTDDVSAVIYELGARVVMLRDNDGYKFHRLFTETALPAVPGATRIVDVGCGFGKSTRPLVARYTGAEVVGIDLSAPNLRLAHARMEAENLPVRFVQAPSYETGLETGSADIVTGTMVLHEMPQDRIIATLQEASRLLKPGGHACFLEFWPFGEPFRDATVYEHAERNNEPFFRDLFGLDVVAAASDAGLAGAAWFPFDETERGLLRQGREPRREWHFPWAVLRATKAGGNL